MTDRYFCNTGLRLINLTNCKKSSILYQHFMCKSNAYQKWSPHDCMVQTFSIIFCNQAEESQTSFIVAFTSGGVAGVVALSLIAVVFFILRY